MYGVYYVCIIVVNMGIRCSQIYYFINMSLHIGESMRIICNIIRNLLQEKKSGLVDSQSGGEKKRVEALMRLAMVWLLVRVEMSYVRA